MRTSWMRLGNWEQRRTWTDDEWVTFLRMWGNYSEFVFGDEHTTEEERNLVDVFYIYFNFFAIVPEHPQNAPEDWTIEVARQQVDA